MTALSQRQCRVTDFARHLCKTVYDIWSIVWIGIQEGLQNLALYFRRILILCSSLRGLLTYLINRYVPEVPNRRADRNKRAGLEKKITLPAFLLSKLVNEQGGIIITWKIVNRVERKSEKSKRACSSIRDFRVEDFKERHYKSFAKNIKETTIKFIYSEKVTKFRKKNLPFFDVSKLCNWEIFSNSVAF